MAILLLILVLGINLILGGMVVIKKPHRSSSYYFLSITVLINLWCLCNVLAEQQSIDIANNDLYNRLSYLFAYLTVVPTVLFTRSLLDKRQRKKWSKRLTILTWLLIALGALLSVTDLVAGNVVNGDNGQLVFEQGKLVVLYAFMILIMVAVAVKYLRMRITKGDYVQKTQARFIEYGLAVFVLMGIILNIIIPAVYPDFLSSSFGTPLLVLFYTVPIAYALLKDHLVDVRPVSAQVTAFAVVFVTLTAFFVLVLTAINSLISASYQIPYSTQLLYAVSAVVFGFGVYPLYRIYQKLFERLFLGKVYDSQRTLNELNKVLVANIGLNELLPRIQRLFRQTFNTSFTVITIGDAIFFYGQRSLSDEQLVSIKNALQKKRYSIIVTRYLEKETPHQHVYDTLSEHHISAVSRLKEGKETIGNLMFGDKRSELPYTNRELEMIEIITDQISLAIRNSLRYEQIESFNTTLKHKVNEATKELRRSNQELMTLDTAKDDFVNMASHQLRTPLTSIEGYVSMVLEGDVGEVTDNQRQLLAKAYANARRMAYLITDLLSVSRITTGKMQVNDAPCDIAAIVNSETQLAAETATTQQITLTAEVAPDIGMVRLDEEKIRQVIRGMITNALNYTPPGGVVTVRLYLNDKDIVFTVQDSGIGVPKGEQHYLFTKFYRATNARKMVPDGSGLALFMARSIISAEGGTVLFRSDDSNGSTFGFEVPIR